MYSIYLKLAKKNATDIQEPNTNSLKNVSIFIYHYVLLYIYICICLHFKAISTNFPLKNLFYFILDHNFSFRRIRIQSEGKIISSNVPIHCLQDSMQTFCLAISRKVTTVAIPIFLKNVPPAKRGLGRILE